MVRVTLALASLAICGAQTCRQQKDSRVSGEAYLQECGLNLFDCCERCSFQQKRCISSSWDTAGCCSYYDTKAVVHARGYITVLPNNGPSPPPTPPPPTPPSPGPNKSCAMSYDWNTLPCNQLFSRPLADGQRAAEGWQPIGTTSGGFWTTDYNHIRDGGEGRLSCGGACFTNTALGGGGQWRPNPHGFPVPDVRIWGTPGNGPNCQKNCAFVASENTFSFGPGDTEVYTVDFDVKVYGENCGAWYAVWLDPVCYTPKCPGLGAHLTEIDMVENYPGEGLAMNYDTCRIGSDSCYVGGPPPLDGLPAAGIGAGSCLQGPYFDMAACGGDGKTKVGAYVNSHQLDHHVSMQWAEHSPAQTPPNGKVTVSTCSREVEQWQGSHCACSPQHSRSTMGPAGWADNQYKFVVDIWGVEFRGNQPTCDIEVSNLRFLNRAGNHVRGNTFVPSLGATNAVCNPFYAKYNRANSAEEEIFL